MIFLEATAPYLNMGMAKPEEGMNTLRKKGKEGKNSKEVWGSFQLFMLQYV